MTVTVQIRKSLELLGKFIEFVSRNIIEQASAGKINETRPFENDKEHSILDLC